MADRRPQRYSHGELVVVIDVADLEPAADFWTALLGYVRKDASDNYLSLVPEGGTGVEILLQRVPDQKQGKNRLHLDLRTADLDAEVARVRRLGARQLTEDPVAEAGWSWHILTDPDGNEFCVLQAPVN
jgi:predicted enzyme related to lactoylglutathione lyase